MCESTTAERCCMLSRHRKYWTTSICWWEAEQVQWIEYVAERRHYCWNNRQNSWVMKTSLKVYASLPCPNEAISPTEIWEVNISWLLESSCLLDGVMRNDCKDNFARGCRDCSDSGSKVLMARNRSISLRTNFVQTATLYMAKTRKKFDSFEGGKAVIFL